jgi:response regulator RpfG family c-di-GMP phosphodiesterase
MTFSKNDQRRVLLIDHDSRRQQLRAAALRNSEIEVHPASSVDDASRLFSRRSYDLVLLAAEEDSEEATMLSNELKKSKARQRVALLVGAPEYIREMGRRRAMPEATDKRLAPPLAISGTGSPRSQWQVMLERLLAAG